MKSKKILLALIGGFLVFSLLQISCSTAERTAVACPEFSGNKNYKLTSDHKRNKNKPLSSHNRLNKRKSHVNHFAGLLKKKQQKDVAVLKVSPNKDKITVPGIENINELNKIEYSNSLTASIDEIIMPIGWNNYTDLSSNKIERKIPHEDLIVSQPALCDTIVLRSGSVIHGKVEEIGPDGIKYRKCNNLTGPLISISKSDLSVILYANGTRDFFSSANSAITSNKQPVNDNYSVTKKTETLGLIGFISSLTGLLVAAVPLGMLAIIFGGLSLGKIKREPDQYKGKGLAIAGIIIGVLDVVLGLILIASLV